MEFRKNDLVTLEIEDCGIDWLRLSCVHACSLRLRPLILLHPRAERPNSGHMEACAGVPWNVKKTLKFALVLP